MKSVLRGVGQRQSSRRDDPSPLYVRKDRREYEDAQFWFRDGGHWPEVVAPWDATIYEYALASLSQYNTRHYVIPPALGVDFRILNGYTYLSPVGVTDPAESGARVPHFVERAGYYFRHWDSLYEGWLVKIRSLVRELSEIRSEALPEREPIEGASRISFR